MKKNDCLILEARLSATKPLCIVLLHGINANGENLLPIALELQKRIPSSLLALPNAPTMPVTLNGGISMPSWYDVISLKPPAANCEQVKESVDELDELVKQLIDEGYSADNVFIAGFSQGGSVALAYGLSSKRSCGGIICMSGFLPPCPELIPKEKIQAPILLMHGTRDETVPFKYCLQTKEQLSEQQPELMQYNLEHYIGMTQIEDLSAWILSKTSP